MNIRHGKKQNLIALAEHLHEMAASEQQPAPYDWGKMRQAIEDDAVFLETYVIPRTEEEEPGYKSVAPRIAEFTPPERADLEVHADESQAGVPFLANGAKP